MEFSSKSFMQASDKYPKIYYSVQCARLICKTAKDIVFLPSLQKDKGSKEPILGEEYYNFGKSTRRYVKISSVVVSIAKVTLIFSKLDIIRLGLWESRLGKFLSYSTSAVVIFQGLSAGLIFYAWSKHMGPDPALAKGKTSSDQKRRYEEGRLERTKEIPPLIQHSTALFGIVLASQSWRKTGLFFDTVSVSASLVGAFRHN